MKIDIYTFAIVLGITHAIQFIIFLVEYVFHKNYKGPGWWLLWSISGVVGFLFLVARQIPAIEQLSILGQNTMMVLATFFLYIGIMRFLGKVERKYLLAAIFFIFILPFSYFIFVEDSIQIRTIILWSAISTISFLSGYDLYKHQTKSVEIAAKICITVFLFHGAFAMIKVISLLNGNEITSVTSQEFFNTSSYIEVLIITIFWTYALIMMINQRLTSEMKLAKDYFEVIFSTSPDPILITGLDEGVITTVNDKFFELSGYRTAEAIGKTTTELRLWHHPNERKNYVDILEKDGYCVDYEAVFLRKDQVKLTCLISGRIIRLEEKLQIISIIRDISGRKKKEEELLLKNLQLQTLNSEKDKFFSIIAHDLKNPFSTFLGLTEIMAEESNDLSLNEVIQLSANMRDSARNLFGLLENLLEWSMIKQGVSLFNPIEILLAPEVTDSISTYSDAAQKKQIRVVSELSGTEMVYADPNMLRSLIRNLLSNAIKFTPNGGSVTLNGNTMPDQSYLISVKDTGIGIGQSLQKLLFNIGNYTSRKGTNGELSTGLGLLLCSEFVTKHNGEIWVDSREGEGSTFYIKLPPKPNS